MCRESATLRRAESDLSTLEANPIYVLLLLGIIRRRLLGQRYDFYSLRFAECCLYAVDRFSQGQSVLAGLYQRTGSAIAGTAAPSASRGALTARRFATQIPTDAVQPGRWRW